MHDVAGKDLRGDSRDLADEVHDAAHLADAGARRDQRRNRPADRRSRGEPADRYADPGQRLRRAVRVGRAQNAQPACRARHQHNLAHQRSIPSARDERIHQHSAEKQVRCRGEEPRHAGVEEGVQQIDVQRL